MNSYELENPGIADSSVCFASVIEHEIRDGSRALVLAHRGELLTPYQRSQCLKAIFGLAEAFCNISK